MYRSILVPIDGSGNANKALEVALLLARACRASLYLLHVPHPQPTEGLPGRPTGAAHPKDSAAAHREAGLHLVQTALDTVDTQDIEPEILIVTGRPDETVLREAQRRDVDAVVLGHRGLGRARDARGGSVSSYINRHADCRVITVR